MSHEEYTKQEEPSVVLRYSLSFSLPFRLSGQSEDRSVVIVFSRACHSSPFGIVASLAPVLTNAANTFVLRHLIDGELIQNHRDTRTRYTTHTRQTTASLLREPTVEYAKRNTEQRRDVEEGMNATDITTCTD